MVSSERNGHANGNGHVDARRAAAPLTTVSDGGSGHDAKGRFALGNQCAAGNPFARRMARLRSVLLDAVTEADLQEVTRALVRQAKGGDAAAAKVLLAYLIGRPGGAVDPDALNRDEWRLCQEFPDDADVHQFSKVDFAKALRILRGLETTCTPVREPE